MSVVRSDATPGSAQAMTAWKDRIAMLCSELDALHVV